MISVDTNIIVRLLTGDDREQFERAKSIFENHTIFITTTVIMECEWVLRYAYRFKASEISDAIESLFGLPNVRLQEPLVMYEAVKWHQHGMDFADAVHLANSRDSEIFVTFDKKLIKSASRLTDLSVKSPQDYNL